MSRHTWVQSLIAKLFLPVLSGVVGFFLMLAIPNPVFGFEIEGYPFSLEGQSVEYENNTKSIIASGNVRVSYQGYKIDSDYFYYNAVNRTILFENNVVISQGDRIVKGEKAFYSFDQKDGYIHQVTANLDGASIRGEELTVSSQNAVIKKPRFTTCDLTDHHHYTVQSSEMAIYPESGSFVGRGNVVHFLGFPIFYIPTYVYNSDENDQANRAIPEFGSNRVDGTYGKWHSTYFISPQSSGTMTVGYANNRGLIVGAHHRFVLQADKRLFIKGYSVHKTGLEGGLVYEQDVYKDQDPDEEKKIFDKLLNAFNKKETGYVYVSLQGLHNELVNYHLVDYSPYGELNAKRLGIGFDSTLTSKVSGGKIKDSQYEGYKLGLDAKVQRVFPLSQYLDFSVAGQHIGFVYPGKGRWDRWLGELGLTLKVDRIVPEITYRKLIAKRGISPFLFDSDNTIQTDELGLKVTLDYDDLFLEVEGDMNLVNKTWRNIIYTVGIKQHCWQWSVSVNTIWQELRFGISLLPMGTKN